MLIRLSKPFFYTLYIPRNEYSQEFIILCTMIHFVMRLWLRIQFVWPGWLAETICSSYPRESGRELGGSWEGAGRECRIMLKYRPLFALMALPLPTTGTGCPAGAGRGRRETNWMLKNDPRPDISHCQSFVWVIWFLLSLILRFSYLSSWPWCEVTSDAGAGLCAGPPSWQCDTFDVTLRDKWS